MKSTILVKIAYNYIYYLNVQVDYTMDKLIAGRIYRVNFELVNRQGLPVSQIYTKVVLLSKFSK